MQVLRRCNNENLFLCEGSESHLVTVVKSGFGSLEVACWPLVPKFVGSNPAEAVGFHFTSLPSEGK